MTNFIHNSQNQLIKIQEYNGTAVAKETKYFYDVLGRRVKKAHTDFEVNSKSFTRKFSYDGNEILNELDGDNNVLSTFTHSGLRTDDVLAVDRSGTSYYYLKDHLGTINDIIDASGNLVQHYVYSPFGKIRKIESSSGADITATLLVENFYTYTGREYDSESGLFYYRARYLDSEAGRFIESDPHPGALTSPITFFNKYIYGSNSPIVNYDPTGTTSLKKVLGISMAVFFPGVSFLLMNTTNVFENSFGFSNQNIAVFNQIFITTAIIVAASLTGGAAGAGAANAFGAAMSGGVTGAFSGAVVGGALTVLTGGNFADGAVLGAKIGFIAGMSAGLKAGTSSKGGLIADDVSIHQSSTINFSYADISREVICQSLVPWATGVGGLGGLIYAASLSTPPGMILGAGYIAVGATAAYFSASTVATSSVCR